MKSSSYRVIRFLELRLTHGADALSREPYDLGAIIAAAKQNGFHQRSVREGAKRSVRIVDSGELVIPGHRYSGMLFSLADRSLVDAAYAVIETGETRSVGKEPGEGNRTEAHLLIDLGYEWLGSTQVYKCALEEATGLSPSQILGRLRPMLHKGARRTGISTSGEEVAWSPDISLEGLFSGDLLTEMANGSLGGFDLLKDELQAGGIDEHDRLRRRKQVLEIGVSRAPNERRTPMQVVKDSLSAVLALARTEGWGKVRVHYSEAGTKKSHSVDVDVSELDDDLGNGTIELERAVVKTARVVLDDPLNDDHEEVVEILLKKMAVKLNEQE